MKTQRSHAEAAVSLSRFLVLGDKGEVLEKGWRAVAAIGGTNVGEIVIDRKTLSETLAAVSVALVQHNVCRALSTFYDAPA